MKKRTKYIIFALICALPIAAYELYLRTSRIGGEPTSALNGMYQQAAPWLIIAFFAVAFHDIVNTRSRKETPPDYIMVKGFRIQEKKCSFGEECMVILHMAHCAKNMYNVTVTMTYLNAAGRVLGQEKQTIVGFSRGMEKHLCFRPGREFHSFSYTLETTLFRGISAERDYRIESSRITPLRQGEAENVPQKGICPVVFYVTEEYEGTQAVDVSGTYILLDKENTVHGLHPAAPRRLTEPVPAHTFPAAEFSYLSKGEIPIDEELPKEGVTGICVYAVTPVSR